MTGTSAPTVTCRSCGAEIEWARFSSGGKRVPLDPPGDEPGNLVVLGRQAGLPIVTVVAAGLGDRTSHFATCPRSTASDERASAHPIPRGHRGEHPPVDRNERDARPQHDVSMTLAYAHVDDDGASFVRDLLGLNLDDLLARWDATDLLVAHAARVEAVILGGDQ